MLCNGHDEKSLYQAFHRVYWIQNKDQVETRALSQISSIII